MKILRIVFPVLVAAALQAQPAPVFPKALQTYLGLTDPQAASIAGLNVTYLRFNAEKQMRIAQVRAELAQQTNAEPLDPMALGMGYAEIEAINRDLRDKLAQLRADTVKVLTPAQQPKLAALARAADLQPLVTEASCQDLLPPFPGNIIPASRYSPISGAVSVLLPNPFYGPTQRCGPLEPGLVAYLVLTPAQVASIGQLQAAYQRFRNEKQQRIGQVLAYIDDLTNAEPLDPGAIGMAYAELEAINRDLKDKENGLRSDLQNLLTDPQKANLKALSDAAALQPLIGVARCENLLPPAPQQWFNTSSFQMTPVIRSGDFTPTPVQMPVFVPCGI